MIDMAESAAVIVSSTEGRNLPPALPFGQQVKSRMVGGHLEGD